MKIKTTFQIIDENQDLAEKILEQEPDIEKYSGEFKETYEKKWVALDDMIALLEDMTKGRFEIIKALEKES